MSLSLENIPLDVSLNLEEEILRLKTEKKAIILAHYYQESEIQDLADCLGDSLALARAAEKADCEVIVFCGVHFMAETAKILNPDKIVVLPDLEAGCSLAESCPAEKLEAWREKHPDHKIVSYINCSAKVKALSDVICTSSNAEKIIRSFPKNQALLFAPDKNLGAWLIKQTGREMLLWPGSCLVHETFSERKIIELKMKHPEAPFIAHPECEEKVLRHADFISSTSGLLKYVKEKDAPSFIVGTETGILHQMKLSCPEKLFIEAPVEEGSCACNECPHMKLNTLEKLYLCLRDLKPQLEMPENLRQQAWKPLEKMLKLS
jgi:quinolinate synthase